MNNHIYLQLISLNKKHTEHYLRRYVKLISFYKERNWSYKFGFHEHHIIPESFGGPDTKENLVFITIREHFILHWMLYKAFPKSQMTTAFHFMCHCSGQKVSSKVHEKLMLEFIERQRETTGQRTRKLVVDGKHPWQGNGEFQRKNNLKRVAEGKHPWQGDGEFQRKMNLRRVEEGTNPFSGPEGNNKRLENGTHPSQIKKVCEHCNREFSLGMFVKYHGNRCKLNPLFVDERKPEPKIVCEHCKRTFDKGNYVHYHGDKCKLNPLYKEETKILCEHCNKEFDKGSFKSHHGNRCKLNPLFKDDKPKIECEHCKREFYKANYNQFHGDNCKLKPQI